MKTVPSDARILCAIASKTGFVYRGESKAAFGENLRIATLRSRVTPSSDVRAKVLERQGGACAKCDETFLQATFVFDHIRQRADGGTDDVVNLQYLCQTFNA